MDSIFLQAFLLVNVFIMGILVSIAVRHARAHFRPQEHDEADKPHPRTQTQGAHLPPAIKERLLQASQAHFQAVLDRSATELQHDLKTTAFHINRQLSKLGADIVNDEMKRYHTSLEQLRKQAETTLLNAQAEIATHQAEINNKLAKRQAELEAQLNEEIALEKQNLTKQIDTKLADAVASFLIDTLQHDVDLGAQSAYLTATLEEHKAEIIKGVNE